MPGHNVAAIVVTFHPDLEVLDNLRALRPQVANVIVVDNGSSAAELATLRATCDNLGVRLIENGDNLGVASALNIGVGEALRLEADWVLLFDQDSRVTDGFTAAMLRCFESSRWGERLALLVPRYQDLRSGSPLPEAERGPDGSVAVTITSGSLFRATTLMENGSFEDQLFIDGVDHEYSLRLRGRGLILDECSAATLLHSPGNPRVFRLLGKVRFQTTNYSPTRRYYQERNKIWIYRRYFRRFPGYCLGLLLGSLKDFSKIVLFESDSMAKVRSFAHGIADGLRQRMGRR